MDIFAHALKICREYDQRREIEDKGREVALRRVLIRTARWNGETYANIAERYGMTLEEVRAIDSEGWRNGGW